MADQSSKCPTNITLGQPFVLGRLNVISTTVCRGVCMKVVYLTYVHTYIRTYIHM